jgi:hypothetical protein
VLFFAKRGWQVNKAQLDYAIGRVAELEARIEALEAALRGLHHECLQAGFGTAKDYAWPKVMREAELALASQSETFSEHGK